MITKPTVLILGAGASSMYNFPTGAQLRNQILGSLRNLRAESIQKYSYMGFDKKEVDSFVNAFSQSGVASIDAFLEHRREFINIGKTVIAETLIPYENESTLFGQSTDWYGYLLDRMNATVEDFATNKLTVLTFNYDRSLEWYFFKALQARFGIGRVDAAKMMTSIPIIHLYGSLGGLPWEDTDRPYTPSNERQDIYAARDNIKIIHEDIENDKEFTRGLNALSGAKRIVFLGFGYNRVNIKRLSPERWSNCETPIRGTAYGLTDLETTYVKKVIKHDVKFGFMGWNVLQFLREHVQLETL